MSKKITLTIEVTWNDAILEAYADSDDAMEDLRDDIGAAVWDHISEGMFCDLPPMPDSVPDQLQMEIIEECIVVIDEMEYTDPVDGWEEGAASTSNPGDEKVPFAFNRKNEA